MIVFLIWCVYALFEGYREGVYWHVKIHYKGPQEFKEHFFWSCQRFVVLLLVVYIDGPLTGLSCMLVFPLLHDGMMYTKRNIIRPDLYTKRFLAQSTTSSAVLTKFFPPVVRIICALAGVGLVIYMEYVAI